MFRTANFLSPLFLAQFQHLIDPPGITLNSVLKSSKETSTPLLEAVQWLPISKEKSITVAFNFSP